MINDVEGVADANCVVLLEGESGTGKELIAGIIHEVSRGPEAPFEAINCGAIPETLLESELFGHVPGAFTGAVSSHRGIFERACHGSVLLDEITEMSPSAQVRLLRVLQEGTFVPVGGEERKISRARVMAATNRDLAKEVERKRFRQDLYYRLNVFPIRIPPLRERREDIPLLIEAFLDCNAKQLGRPRPRVHPTALGRLTVYSYPGNVRELQNIVSALLIEARGAKEITDQHVIAVFSRHRLQERDSSDGHLHSPPSTHEQHKEIGEWVMEQLRNYHFNLALAERMLTARKMSSADRRAVPVCSRSGLTYYLQGEAIRALLAEGWDLDAAALRLAEDRVLIPRVRKKLRRFLRLAAQATKRVGNDPGARLLKLRRTFIKIPLDYRDDLIQFSQEFESRKWS